MPIYEYRCQACEHVFEILVRGDVAPECPACRSQDLERLLSMPRVHSEARKQRSLKAARERDRKRGDERVRAQREYELKHND